MVKITEDFVRRANIPSDTDPKSGAQYFDDDLPGFGVRIFPSGTAKFFVKVNVGRQQRRKTLGSATERGGLKEARYEARRILLKARVGEDIVGEWRAAEAKAKATVKNTLGALVSEYLEARKGKLRPRTYVEMERYLRKAWAPLHGSDIKGISRADVMAVLDTLDRKDHGGARAADCAKAALSGFFTWAMDHKDRYADGNPTVGIKTRAQGGSRERTLDDAEIREVWHACLDDDHGRITKLLLLSGQRKGEIGGLTWDEIDAAGRQICLPRERCKNDRAHTIPLSDQALALLPERRDGHGHLFGRLPGAGFSGWSKGKTELDGRIANARRAAGVKKAMDPWCLHDLRRTACSGWQRLGIRLEVGEAILNHQSGTRSGVAGIYRRYEYDAEKREALRLWGKHVAEIVR